ncbi:MAG TPA: hypothetical protein DEP05_00450 [Betaproteobacteria bacterium]|nr:hypothetical protein [Betaproteobacteria bacterium]
MRFTPLLLLILLLGLLAAFVQIGALTIAFDKLGLSPASALLLLFALLFGSFFNLPLFSLSAEPPSEAALPPLFRYAIQPPPFTGKTTIAANVGGCLIPLAFSFYLLWRHALPLGQVFAAIAIVAAAYLFSRPVPRYGIVMPIFVAPVTAAIAAMTLNPHQSAPLAYIGGALGVLIGADLLHLGSIWRMGTPLASIGGAGAFDGIFITGVVAVLLA